MIAADPAREPDEGIRVTVEDLKTGETQTAVVQDDYVLVTAGTCHRHPATDDQGAWWSWLTPCASGTTRAAVVIRAPVGRSRGRCARPTPSERLASGLGRCPVADPVPESGAQPAYAVIHVRDGSAHAWPIVERVPGGWESGAHHYPDASVLDVTPLALAGPGEVVVRRERMHETGKILADIGKALLVVKGRLSTPYPDDPRLTPWTRFVERPAAQAYNLGVELRREYRATYPAEPTEAGAR